MFQDKALTQLIIRKIEDLALENHLRFCHICGTHEFAITRFGLRALLPPSIEVIAGPGCPVCIVPAEEVDEAIWLAQHGLTLVTFGDMMRVPGTRMSLSDAKATGSDVRIVYSVTESVKMAMREPEKNFVFFAIGFETTAPTVAAEVLRKPPKNLSFITSHRLIPPAMKLLLGIDDIQIDGFICPGHVATIIGADAFSVFPENYKMPTVIAGFEPIDILMAILMLLKQMKDGARLDNEYARSVTKDGNVKAQTLLKEVFDVVDGGWRGIGTIPSSAYKLKDAFFDYDVRLKYNIETGPTKDITSGCSCHLIILGKINPPSCPMYLKSCTPEHPLGPCMVSHEGTCNIWSRQVNI